MVSRTSVFLLAMIAALAAVAEEPVYVLSITADLDFELFAVTSPSPICWQYWNADVEGNQDVQLHQEYADDIVPCLTGWMLHCDSDSMSCSTYWVEYDPENWHWNFQFYAVEMSARLVFEETVLLKAERSVLGHLSTDEHHAWLTPIGQSDIVLLDSESDDQVELEIEAGVYDLFLHVLAHESGTHYAFSGAVHVWWDDFAATEAVSWGAVKTLYR